MTMLDDDRLASLFGTRRRPSRCPRRARTTSSPGRSARRRMRTSVPRRAATTTPPATQEIDPGTGDATSPAHARLARRRAGERSPAARRHRILSVAACLVVAAPRGRHDRRARLESFEHVQRLSTALPPHGRRRRRTPRSPRRRSPGLGRRGGTVGAGRRRSRRRTLPNSQRPTASRRSVGRDAELPALPQGAVGQSAKIEQTGTLGLSVGRGDLAATMTQLERARRRLRRLRRQLAEPERVRLGRPAFGTITLQVPVDNFSAVLKQAERIGKTSNSDHEGHGRHGPVRRPPGAHRRARGQPPAVPHDPGQGDEHRRHPGRAGAARQHPEPDRAAAGPAAGAHERDLLLDAHGDRQRGRAAAPRRARSPSRASSGRGTTASAASWPASRAWSGWPGRSCSPCCASPSWRSAAGSSGAATSATASERQTLTARSRRPAGCRACHDAHPPARADVLADRHRAVRRAPRSDRTPVSSSAAPRDEHARPGRERARRHRCSARGATASALKCIVEPSRC